ncbi:hypothetical protein RRG08_015131 [Elysia crispata]|uniref:Uncharacterized protein n=1 Tax=Elysia crispata TaxID=231223 RepID=A0AAE1DMZ2_9GAST|nr:hypothetical protein RRG08_015131 [Elysia crispata]
MCKTSTDHASYTHLGQGHRDNVWCRCGYVNTRNVSKYSTGDTLKLYINDMNLVVRSGKTEQNKGGGRGKGGQELHTWTKYVGVGGVVFKSTLPQQTKPTKPPPLSVTVGTMKSSNRNMPFGENRHSH